MKSFIVRRLFVIETTGQSTRAYYPVPVVQRSDETAYECEAGFLRCVKPHKNAIKQHPQRINFAMKRSREMVEAVKVNQSQSRLQRIIQQTPLYSQAAKTRSVLRVVSLIRLEFVEMHRKRTRNTSWQRRKGACWLDGLMNNTRPSLLLSPSLYPLTSFSFLSTSTSPGWST